MLTVVVLELLDDEIYGAPKKKIDKQLNTAPIKHNKFFFIFIKPPSAYYSLSPLNIQIFNVKNGYFIQNLLYCTD